MAEATESSSVEEHLATLESQINHLRGDVAPVKQMSANITAIRTALSGDPTLGIEGVIPRLGRLEHYMEKIKHIEQRFYGALAIVSVVWFFLLKFVK